MAEKNGELGTASAWRLIAQLMDNVLEAENTFLKEDDKDYVASFTHTLAGVLKHFTPTASGLLEVISVRNFIAENNQVKTAGQLQKNIQSFCSAQSLSLPAFCVAAGLSYLEHADIAESEIEKHKLQKKGLYFLTELSRTSDMDRLAMAFSAPNAWSAELTVPDEKNNASTQDVPIAENENMVRGRITAVRKHGKTIFVDVLNQQGKQQVAFSNADKQNPLKLAPGDFICAEGHWAETKTGLNTFFIGTLVKHWHANSESAMKFSSDWKDAHETGKIISMLRAGLSNIGYAEVQTPTLTPSFEGGTARPFRTLENASEETRYLRVTSELNLLKMIAGGAEKVFEIGPSFRNEKSLGGKSREFYMLEAYSILDTTESFTQTICRVLADIIGTKSAFKEMHIKDLCQEKLGLDIYDPTAVSSFIKKNIKDIDVEKYDTAEQIKIIYYKALREKISDPTLVVGMPNDGSPLIKGDRDKAKRIWVCVNGLEIAEIAENETSPQVMSDKLSVQFNRDKNLVNRDYREFIDALSAGLPRVVGIGLGVQRLVQAARIEKQKTLAAALKKEHKPPPQGLK